MAISLTRNNAELLTLNLTPLIDVIFQLLIFFMLSSSFIYPSINLDLPKGEVAEGTQTEQHLVLSMNEKRELFINQRKINLDNLSQELKTELAKVEDKAVYFRADKKLSYEDFFKIMQISTKSGAANFHLIHEPES